MGDVTKIILTNWVPPIISVIIGGMIASLIIPRLQVRFEKSRLYDKRKLELLEATSTSFPRYIANWWRLFHISTLEAEKKQLTQEESDRKKLFVKERNESRDKLLADLSACRIYFSNAVDASIQEFREWDQRCTDLRLSELPDMREWQEWEHALIAKMKSEAVMFENELWLSRLARLSAASLRRIKENRAIKE